MSRSDSEIPDESILKLEAEIGWLCKCLCSRILDIMETERFFPVKGEIPICSEIRVWMCRRVLPTYNASQHGCRMICILCFSGKNSIRILFLRQDIFLQSCNVLFSIGCMDKGLLLISGTLVLIPIHVRPKWRIFVCHKQMSPYNNRTLHILSQKQFSYIILATKT